MKKNVTRRLLSVIVSMVLIFTLSLSFFTVSASGQTFDEIRLPFRDLTGDEIVSEMGLGWNLGNTMDGHSNFMPSETAWQSNITTDKLLTAVHDAGFNTVRVPVTWGLKIDDNNNYTIDKAWMNRVREIADYALSQDMYVIINLHHDGAEQAGWLHVAAEGEELEIVKQKFGRVWEQIAEAFKGYDEHVIFESMNEVKSDDDSQAGIKRDFQVIMELNQIFVDTVRSTGGNNTRRWLLVPGRYTNIVNTTNADNGFKLPDDPWNDNNRLMVSVHDYDYAFGLLDTMAITNWSEDSAAKMAKLFQALIDSFTSKGIPVVLGEYGALNKNNTEARAYYYEVMARLSRVSGVVCCAWDIGWYDKTRDPDYTYTLFERSTLELLFPEINHAILRGHYGADVSAGINGFKTIVKGTKEEPVKIVPITSIELSTNSLALSVGSWEKVTAEALPADSNEVVLYSTSDPSVATVYNGLIRAKGIGRCTITATSLSNKTTETIEVTVYPDDTLKSPLSKIDTQADSFSIMESDFAQIKINMPKGTDDVVSFTSSDPSVVSVGKLGTMTGKGIGKAYVIITTRSGLSKVVSVEVTKLISLGDAPDIAVYAYYNDSEHSFFDNVQGESLTITSNGTYTLTLDCAKHLPGSAKMTGVTTLNNVGAIYLADTLARSGLFASCDIMYDEILLDGKPLTITQQAPKSALKSGGRFDTNDPVNAWDGSYVTEAVTKSNMITFDGFSSPKVITITFTLSNFVLSKDAQAEPEIEPVPASVTLSSDSVTINSLSTSPFAVTLSPLSTTDTACFVSEKSGVVWVSSVAAAPGSNGTVTAQLVPLGTGEAEVYVLTQNGDTAIISVNVTAQRPALSGTADVYIEPSDYTMPLIEPPVEDESSTAQDDSSVADSAQAELKDGTSSILPYVLIGFFGALAILGVIAVFVFKSKKPNE